MLLSAWGPGIISFAKAASHPIQLVVDVVTVDDPVSIIPTATRVESVDGVGHRGQLNPGHHGRFTREGQLEPTRLGPEHNPIRRDVSRGRDDAGQ